MEVPPRTNREEVDDGLQNEGTPREDDIQRPVLCVAEGVLALARLKYGGEEAYGHALVNGKPGE